MDLKNLMDILSSIVGEPCQFIGVGCSLGAAILWTYVELFGSRKFSGMVFVDQAPLQDYLPDGSWSAAHGNYGCHDAASLAWAQETLRTRPEKFYQGLVKDCLAYRCKPAKYGARSSADVSKDESFFITISKQGNPDWFAKLLANHTSYDHRDTLARVIECPCLVMAGADSGCFPLGGMVAIKDLISTRNRRDLCHVEVLQSGHCKFLQVLDCQNSCTERYAGMFYEMPKAWSTLVLKQCKKYFGNEVQRGKGPSL